MMRRNEIATATIIFLLTTACGGATMTSSRTAPVSVSGRLATVGGPVVEGTNTGIQGTVTFGSTSGQTDVQTRVDGSFETQMEPGTYRVSGRSEKFGGGSLECHTTEDKLTITENGATDVFVACSAK